MSDYAERLECMREAQIRVRELLEPCEQDWREEELEELPARCEICDEEPALLYHSEDGAALGCENCCVVKDGVLLDADTGEKIAEKWTEEY